MTDHEAMIALATPPPEPFKQVRWQREDYKRYDAWHATYIEAVRHAGVVPI